MKQHEGYTPGQGWSQDFEYEDMLQAGIDLKITDDLDLMEKIVEDFTDVNYHREAAHLYDAIDALKAGEKAEAQKYLKAFQKECQTTLDVIIRESVYMRERFTKLAGLINEAKTKEELAAELKAAFKAGPAATRAFLDTSDGQSDVVRKELLLSPEIDGDMSDDTVAVGTAAGTAMDYKPTQSEIDLMKSVSYPLGSAKTLTDAITTGPTAKGIVTSGDLIIDGHHRWSGAISIGGNNAKVSGKDVNWPGKDTQEKLAAAQIAIAAELGPGKPIPSQDKPFKTNIMGKDAAAIGKMIMQNVNKKTDPNAPGALLNDDMMQDLTSGENKDINIVLKWLGPLADRVKDKVGPGKPSSEDAIYQLRIAIATKVGQNLEKLPNNPDAPERKDMPQFDPTVGGPKIDSITGKLKGNKAGNFNVAPPFNQKESVNKKLDNMLKESIIKIK